MAMDIPDLMRNFLRKGRFNPSFIKLAKLFHIHKAINRVYLKVALPRDKKIKILLFGYPTRFYVENIGDLAYIEGVLLDKREGELRVLHKLTEVLERGDVVYDIGANIGIHTIFMAKNVGKKGKVVAIEPDNINFGRLKMNLSLNHLYNVIPIQVALADESGKGNLYINHRAGRAAISLIESEESTLCQTVEIISGDMLVNSRNLPPPKIVKIDVEGYEYPVIKGLRQTLSNEVCQFVCCEIHSKRFPIETKPSTIIDLLKSLGFIHIESYKRGGEIHAFCYRNKYELFNLK